MTFTSKIWSKAACRAAAVVVALAAPAGAIMIDTATATTLSFQNSFSEVDNVITGPHRSSSFLTPGYHATDSLGLLYNRKTKDANWTADVEGRATDDPRIDAKRFNLKKAYLKRQNDFSTSDVGDIYTTFSQYSLDHSLKGGQVQFNLDHGFHVTTVAGFDKPNWDDVWNHNYNENVDRQVYGLRLQKTFDHGASVGVSGVDTKDELARYAALTQLLDERLVGLDWSLPSYNKLSISGETAMSHTDQRNPGTDANGSPVLVGTSQTGWAQVYRLRYSYKKYKTLDEFERVEQAFATTEGAASPDLMRLKTNNTMTITGPWRWVMLNYTYFHNNVAGTSSLPTTTTRMPETGVRYEAPDWRPDLSVEAKWRYREVVNSGSALRKKTNSAILGVEDRLGPFKLTVDYEFQHEDASDMSTNANHNIVGVGCDSFFVPSPGWKLSESVRWDLQRDRDNLLNATDQTGTIKANGMFHTPWAVDGGVTFTRTLVLNAQNPSNERKATVASLGYNILKKPEHRIQVNFRQNDNLFDDPTKNYKETTWELALTDRF